MTVPVKRKRGRPRKSDVSSVKKGSRNAVGRPKGDAAVINEYKARMLAVEKLVLPLIANLQKDGETKEYIKWPNRTAILETQKTKILQVTRSEIG